MDDLDELYALKPAGFVAARDALVARLRKEGDRERAAEVKALRRPSVAAWVLNRLAREEPKALEELESLGNELRSAQRAALSGAGADRLRDATRRRRVVVERLARRAEAILEREGMASSPQASAVRSALEAAAADPEAALRLRVGRLEREPEGPSGFGDLGGLRLVVDEESEAEGEPAADDAEAERAAERARRVEEAQRAAELARAQAEEADKEVEALAAALDEARAASKAAQRAARDAEEAAVRASTEAD